ncbi:excalibur calcium-binding domain-containing protein [Croceicoccus sp. BE223]|uniref:excalibur calcium-binding domain-containing protein n=1 Tax=Croceicoccus sp. BE223 TaxID=2817716 RepID=UPI00286CCFFC|nr:excalibur calcium-binding domain-containing protein [Croceicoccus sp. BE223]
MSGRRFGRGAALLVLLAGAAPVLPHGGGVDAAGCHVEKRTGLRHCHGQRASTQPPVVSAQGGYYPTCAEVRAAGRAPLRRDEPGYRAGLDRDGDGVACEVHR